MTDHNTNEQYYFCRDNNDFASIDPISKELTGFQSRISQSTDQPFFRKFAHSIPFSSEKNSFSVTHLSSQTSFPFIKQLTQGAYSNSLLTQESRCFQAHNEKSTDFGKRQSENAFLYISNPKKFLHDDKEKLFNDDSIELNAQQFSSEKSLLQSKIQVPYSHAIDSTLSQTSSPHQLLSVEDQMKLTNCSFSNSSSSSSKDCSSYPKENVLREVEHKGKSDSSFILCPSDEVPPIYPLIPIEQKKLLKPQEPKEKALYDNYPINDIISPSLSKSENNFLSLLDHFERADEIEDAVSIVSEVKRKASTVPCNDEDLPYSIKHADILSVNYAKEIRAMFGEKLRKIEEERKNQNDKPFRHEQSFELSSKEASHSVTSSEFSKENPQKSSLQCSTFEPPKQPLTRPDSVGSLSSASSITSQDSLSSLSSSLSIDQHTADSIAGWVFGGISVQPVAIGVRLEDAALKQTENIAKAEARMLLNWKSEDERDEQRAVELKEARSKLKEKLEQEELFFGKGDNWRFLQQEMEELKAEESKFRARRRSIIKSQIKDAARFAKEKGKWVEKNWETRKEERMLWNAAHKKFVEKMLLKDEELSREKGETIEELIAQYKDAEDLGNESEAAKLKQRIAQKMRKLEKAKKKQMMSRWENFLKHFRKQQERRCNENLLVSDSAAQNVSYCDALTDSSLEYFQQDAPLSCLLSDSHSEAASSNSSYLSPTGQISEARVESQNDSFFLTDATPSEITQFNDQFDYPHSNSTLFSDQCTSDKPENVTADMNMINDSNDEDDLQLPSPPKTPPPALPPQALDDCASFNQSLSPPENTAQAVLLPPKLDPPLLTTPSVPKIDLPVKPKEEYDPSQGLLPTPAQPLPPEKLVVSYSASKPVVIPKSSFIASLKAGIHIPVLYPPNVVLMKPKEEAPLFSAPSLSRVPLPSNSVTD
eukprot:MONOS_7622.1-p1 / transcript=MONOS_7622.1 / gene=MONOS_7622 / organism=Monocercomonoides_exilis_PA203 / gene_product=unspecified product / transcript_product=unspecified product / location=Mono_scaffold00265:53940-56747(+) / protein_length=936 / sequence_SO=supercontig / SO=protein_coding / is_pseudo=false